MQFDSVQIGAADVSAAVRAYQRLLGRVPTRGENAVVRFQLQRGAVEVEPGEAGLRGMRFTVAPNAAPLSANAFHGLRVSCTTAAPPPASAPAAGCIAAIDHVVITSPDLDRAIALWRDRLGVRLALDREFPARGLRILFFRSGGVTLEVVGALKAAAPTGPDSLQGIAYRVDSLERCRERLLQLQLDVSPIRSGQKPRTLVATVRNATAGVPTLLIEDLSKDG